MGAETTPTATPDPTNVLDTGEAGGKVIRGSALRVIGYAATAILGLASAPLLVRHLGIVEFGRYTTVLSLVALGAGITEAGLGAIALREYVARSGAERAAFMRSLLGARIVLTAVGIAGSCVFALVTGYEGVLVLGTLLAGIGLLIGIVQSTFTVPLGASLRLGWITFGDVARSAAVVVLVVALILLDSGLVPFLALTIPTNIALLAMTAWLVRGMIPFRPSFEFRELRGLLRDTLPFAVAVALSTLYFRVVIIMMSLIATGLQTGYFATSYRITEVLSTLPGLVVATAFPILSRAARDDDARLGYALQRMFEMAVIGGLAMTVFLVIGADLAIEFIGGDDAAPAADVLRIQAVALPLLALTMTWGHGLLALRRHRDLLVVNATALVVVVVFAAVLIPPFEAEGAALAVVLGETVLAGFAGLLLGRARGALLESVRVVPLVALASGATLAVGLLPDLPLGVRLALAAIVYPALLVALRAVPSELLAAFRRGQGTR